MTEKDFQIDGYYVAEWTLYGKNKMDLILKYGGSLSKEVNKFISAQSSAETKRHYNPAGSCCTATDNITKFRKATQDEIEWLDACILADTFVEKPKIIENFQIY